MMNEKKFEDEMLVNLQFFWNFYQKMLMEFLKLVFYSLINL